MVNRDCLMGWLQSRGVTSRLVNTSGTDGILLLYIFFSKKYVGGGENCSNLQGFRQPLQKATNLAASSQKTTTFQARRCAQPKLPIKPTNSRFERWVPPRWSRAYMNHLASWSGSTRSLIPFVPFLESSRRDWTGEFGATATATTVAGSR